MDFVVTLNVSGMMSNLSTSFVSEFPNVSVVSSHAEKHTAAMAVQNNCLMFIIIEVL